MLRNETMSALCQMNDVVFVSVLFHRRYRGPWVLLEEVAWPIHARLHSYVRRKLHFKPGKQFDVAEVSKDCQPTAKEDAATSSLQHE